MRNLASIKLVDGTAPIEGKDRIELAFFSGWQIIVKKGEFKVGDKAVFIEIDSVLPEKPEFEFLRSKKFRIKTMKMSGIVSQGICFPLDILLPGNYEVDQDVTELLGIKQYEATMDVDPTTKVVKERSKLFKYFMRFKWFRMTFGKNKKEKFGFPDFITKTDEVRCLVANTKIETEKGKIRIGHIVNKRLNVKVKSYNATTKEIEYKEIEDYQRIENKEDIYKITYLNKGCGNKTNSMICTADHKFFKNEEYIEAKKLKINDSINTIDYSYGREILPIIYGMVLGDCSINFDKRPHKDGTADENCRIMFCQGYAQLEYLKFKQSLFENGDLKFRQGKSGYCDNIVYQGHIKVDNTISKDLASFCDENKKLKITKEFAEKLDPISLAIWYMDDGSLKHKGSEIQKPSIMISSNSFSLEENEILVDVLKNKFGIECNVRNDKKYYAIYITVKGTYDFLKLISKYIHPSLRYKTIKEFEDVPFEIESLTFKKEFRLMETKILNIEKVSQLCSYVYDITVKDNHNFFANNILTHNCQNIPHILDNKDIKYVVTEKIDGSSLTVFLKRIGKKKFDFGVCSRNVRLSELDGGNYWNVVRKYKIEEALRKLIQDNDFIAIQGEVIAPTIQGNKYKVTEPDFFAFNLIYPQGRLSSVYGEELLSNFGIKWVPIVKTDYVLPDTVNELLDAATGESALYPTLREGWVLRNAEKNISFKAVSPSFLLKYDE